MVSAHKFGIRIYEEGASTFLYLLSGNLNLVFWIYEDWRRHAYIGDIILRGGDTWGDLLEGLYAEAGGDTKFSFYFSQRNMLRNISRNIQQQQKGIQSCKVLFSKRNMSRNTKLYFVCWTASPERIQSFHFAKKYVKKFQIIFCILNSINRGDTKFSFQKEICQEMSNYILYIEQQGEYKVLFS